MKVLLVNPAISLAEYLFSTPALSVLGPLYSAASLRREHDVAFADSCLLTDAVPAPGLASQGRHKLRLGAPTEVLLRQIEALGGSFDAVIIHKARWWSHTRDEERAALFRGVRELHQGALVVLADLFIGDLYLPPYDPAFYLTAYPEIDALLHGAGEMALTALLRTPRPAWPSLPGLACRGDDGGVIFNGFHYANAVDDLDCLPPPAYDLGGARAYADFFRRAEISDLVQESHEGLPFLGLMATRGCNHRCSFCTLPSYGMRWHHHSLHYLEETLDGLAAASGVRKFVFSDPAANADKEFFSALLRLLTTKGYRFHFPNGLRADKLDDAMLDLFKAGGTALLTSLETPDEKALREQVKKGLAPSLVHSLARRCYERDIPLRVHYVVGMPGDSTESVNRTLRYATALWEEYGAFPLVQIATPIGGTEMARLAEEQGFLTQPLAEIATKLPVLFQDESVIDTPTLPAKRTTSMYRRFREHVLGAHPRELTVVLGYACNNNCQHCLTAGLRIAKPSMPAVGERLAAALRRGIRTLVLEGGEPTLHPETIPLIRRARALGMTEVMMETNARRCSYTKYAAALAHSGLTMLFVTAHGAEARAHDRVTRTPGSFEQTRAGVANLLDAGFMNLAVNLPLQKHMLEGEALSETIALYSELGVCRFMLQFLSPFGGHGEEMAAIPTYDEALPALRRALALLPATVSARIMNVPFCLLAGFEAAVHPDINNIGELPLDERESAEIRSLLASGKVMDSTCRQCEFAYLCTGFVPFPGPARAPCMSPS
jgi:MoaA/NifB/PqqE/SkfB family radical SAM enzyme